jgi:hypothetical protein
MISFGAGLGADIIAAKGVWTADGSLAAIFAIEPLRPLSTIGRLLTDGIPSVSWSPSWAANTAPVDLICASFAMGEPVEPPGPGGSPAAAAAAAAARHRALARDLWARCGGVLVLIEAGTPAGFACIAEARDELLRTGDAVPLAPCPHAAPCPMLSAGAGAGAGAGRHWCHFAQRHAAPSFQRMAHDCAGPTRDYLDWRFSYLVVARRPMLAHRWPALAGAAAPTTTINSSSAAAATPIAAPGASPPAVDNTAPPPAAAAAAGGGEGLPNWGRLVRPIYIYTITYNRYYICIYIYMIANMIAGAPAAEAGRARGAGRVRGGRRAGAAGCGPEPRRRCRLPRRARGRLGRRLPVRPAAGPG